MQWIILLTGLLASVLDITNSAKILLIPIPLRSHLSLGVQVGVALQNAGHSVWMIGPQDQQEKLKPKGFHYIPYDITPMYALESNMADSTARKILDPNEPGFGLIEKLTGVTTAMRTQCLSALNNEGIFLSLQGEKFDLAVSGTTVFLNCLLLIPYKYDIPYVLYQPVDTPWDAGVTSFPSFEPQLIVSPPVSDVMSFSERLTNTALTVAYQLVFQTYPQGDISEYQAIVAPEKAPISLAELRQNAVMWFITADNTCVEYPRLSSPHYRHIGGLTLSPAKNLTGDLKEFVDGAKDGLIFIGFGSTTIGSAVLAGLVPKLRIIAPTLKQRIILQFMADEKPKGFPDNVLFQSWVPQIDILGHKNTIAMITHGGASGQTEAMYHSVPCICIGLMEEQQYNCHKLVSRNYGIALDVHALTTEVLQSAMHNITQNPMYMQNVARCSAIMHDMPLAKQELTFWVDHVLKFGASHLRVSSADMPFYKLYMLDIAAFVTVITLIVVVNVFLICRCSCRWAINSIKRKQDYKQE